MTTTSETPTIRLAWPKTGAEIDLAAIQGLWTAEQYLALTEHTRYLVEFTDGVIEVLPMPTRTHQTILAYLYRIFFAALQPVGGIVLFSAFRMQIHPDKYREPDLLLLLDARDPRNQEAYWLGADLVVEIVSPDDPARDTVVKRSDYAEAGISEYWIVNPLDETVTVLALAGSAYVEHGVFGRGERASSRLLAGLGVAVSEVFDA